MYAKHVELDRLHTSDLVVPFLIIVCLYLINAIAPSRRSGFKNLHWRTTRAWGYELLGEYIIVSGEPGR